MVFTYWCVSDINPLPSSGVPLPIGVDFESSDCTMDSYDRYTTSRFSLVDSPSEISYASAVPDSPLAVHDARPRVTRVQRWLQGEYLRVRLGQRPPPTIRTSDSRRPCRRSPLKSVCHPTNCSWKPATIAPKPSRHSTPLNNSPRLDDFHDSPLSWTSDCRLPARCTLV